MQPYWFPVGLLAEGLSYFPCYFYMLHCFCCTKYENDIDNSKLCWMLSLIRVNNHLEGEAKPPSHLALVCSLCTESEPFLEWTDFRCKQVDTQFALTFCEDVNIFPVNSEMNMHACVHTRIHTHTHAHTHTHTHAHTHTHNGGRRRNPDSDKHISQLVMPPTRDLATMVTNNLLVCSFPRWSCTLYQVKVKKNMKLTRTQIPWMI